MNIATFSTRRRVTVGMVTITLVLFGLIGLSNLKVNLLPDLSYPTLTIRTEYVGAAPAEIETLISEPIEEAVGVVKNLRKLRSISRTGQSDVILEFAWGTDMDRASLDVRDKLETLRLPLEAKAPVLLRFNPSTEPIMRMALTVSTAFTGDEQIELMRLRRFAEEDLKKRLEPVDGVAAVKVSGGLEDEVQVLIDEERLAQLDIPIGVVIDRLRQENINISGGRLEEGQQRFLVRTVNQFIDLEQMRDLLVKTGKGAPIRLRDIASVEQGFKERQAIIRVDGREAVEIAIYKEGDANTVATARAVKAALNRLAVRNLVPDERAAALAQAGRDGNYVIDGVTVATIEDASVFIAAALAAVRNEAVLGGALAMLLIFFFLRDGWSTLVISVSLPVSLIATFFFMDQLGLSLNVMSLAGLALATGMVVDDSIVVLESIAKARERGLGIIDAAVAGTDEVRMAVIASTLTTIAVFFPLVFVEGVAGQLFKDQALTVSIALAISLVVSLTLIPMLSSLKARSPLAYAPTVPIPRDPPRNAVLRALAGLPHGLAVMLRGLLYAAAWVATACGRIGAFLTMRVLAPIGARVLRPYEWLAARYVPVLAHALAHPAWVLGSAAAAFVVAMALVPTLGADLIPQLAQDRFEATARLVPGTQLRETDALVRAVQQSHRDDADIRMLYGISGTGSRLDASPTESGENVAQFTIVLGGGLSRATEARVIERLRASFARFTDVEVEFGRPELFSFSTPLEIELRANDLTSLERAGRKLAALIAADPAFADVKSTVQRGYPEIQIRFDQERAAALGLTSRQIADQVVRQVRGEVATRYSFRDRKIDVLVRAREAARSSVADIRKLIVNPESPRPVTLDAVAEVIETIGPSEITRVDQMRVAIVSANLRGLDLGSAVARVARMIRENPLGADVRVAFGGQSEELAASRASLLFAFALAIFLVYLVMASQFESLLHPFVILFTVPLAMVGAVLALFVSGSAISVVVFIGLILLVGVVVKNAIVLIDKVNQLREAGVPKRQAICEGAASRLRPIVMTTLTTLFGFAPLALLGGEGAEVRAPMALTVIGGLAVSTLLTLVVIPVVYDLMDRKSDAAYRERGRRFAGRYEPSPSPEASA